MDDQLLIDLKRTLEFVKTHGWTRAVLARNKTGHIVGLWGDHAARWCLLGAAMRSNNVFVCDLRLKAINDAVEVESGTDAMSYNDVVAKDKRYIIRLLTRMIKKREQK